MRKRSTNCGVTVNHASTIIAVWFVFENKVEATCQKQDEWHK